MLKFTEFKAISEGKVEDIKKDASDEEIKRMIKELELEIKKSKDAEFIKAGKEALKSLKSN